MNAHYPNTLEPTDSLVRRTLLTVGLEDWFQVGAFREVVGERRWSRFDARVELGTENTLALLERLNARATFFTVGWVAARYPELLRTIVDRGHEVATQGWHHRTIEQFPDAGTFRADVERARAAVERATGQRVFGHRTPHFVPEGHPWMREVLAELGYRYDASARPLLWGNAEWQRYPHEVQTSAGALSVIPVSSVRALGADWPMMAGNGLRQLPERWVRAGMDEWFRTAGGAPLVTYFHTWELDPDQPRIDALGRLARRRQYHRLNEMSAVLERLLAPTECTGVAEWLRLVPEPVVPEPVATPIVELARSTPVVRKAAREAVTVVVPCYNESAALDYLEANLEVLCDQLAGRYRLEFVFVDDGSTDDTVQQLRQRFGGRTGYRIVEHVQNRGVARAILSGIEAATTEIVASMDCDCTYDPLELERMIPLLTPEVAMVTASPYHPQGHVVGVPGWRLGLSRGASALYRGVLDASLHTFTSCFRVYRRETVMNVSVTADGFLGVAELLARLVLDGQRVVEYPATLESRIFGHSKMKTLHTIRGHLELLAQLGLWKVGQATNNEREVVRTAAPRNDQTGTTAVAGPTTPVRSAQ